LRRYAKKFGFNRVIASELPFEPGRAEITEDRWELAEAASGFTKNNTMSPLQGALIAAAVVNDGVMMAPYLVESVHTTEGRSLYKAIPQVSSVAVDQPTATQIRALMQETVRRGTARGAFRTFFQHSPAATNIEVGGKTGSLTGMDPQGRYDWFVGYARGSQQKIAFAALTIHEKYWRVKSAYLVRRAIESVFSPNPYFVTESRVTKHKHP
jgi:peptidoglycan glycosyltransferase